MHDGGRGTAGDTRHGLRTALVVAEVALAVILLVGAGLFASSFLRLTNVEIGLDYRNVMTLGVYPPYDPSDPDDRARARDRAQIAMPEMLQRVEALPGVEAAGIIANGLPLSGNWSRTLVRVPGREEPFRGDDSVDIRQVSAGYGTAMRVQVLSGRYLANTDSTGSQPVVVLNEAAARRYFEGEDPLGRTIGINGDRTVVGVVNDVRLGGPESDVRPEAYVPFSQSSQVGSVLVVRTTDDPAVLTDAVKNAVWLTYPDTVLDDLSTMESLFGGLIAQRQFNMLLVGVFGILAVVIAAVGIYGVMAYSVTQRTPEIGVRMALGAEPGRVLVTVLRSALVFLSLGLVVGLGGAWLLAGSIEGFLFEIQPHDTTVYVATAGVLLLVGLVAALVPALRASRIDPLIALRN